MEGFKKRFFTYGFLLLGLTILVLVIYMLLPFWQPITLALISAVVFYPVFKFFRKLLFSDFFAAFFSLLTVISVVVVPFIVAAAIFGQELAKLISNLQEFINKGGLDLLVNEIQSKFYIYFYKLQAQYPTLGEILNEENLKSWLKNIYIYLSNLFAKSTKEVFFWLGSTIFGLFIYLTTLFFAFYQGKTAVVHIKRVLPLEERDKEEILQTVYNAITGVIYGTVGTAIVQSVIALGLYIYYGLSYPFLWALITALFAFIPPFGTGYVWFPITLYEFLLVNKTKGLIGFAVGFLIISSIDNFVRPLIMKEKIELPYVVLFFSVVGGLLAFGFTGIFLGPTIFALFITLIRIYEEKFSQNGAG